MSIGNATKTQDLEPDRLKPARGARTLRASVEAKGPAGDLCSGTTLRDGVRERILAWLAEGAREVTWALCSLPRERWVTSPPQRPDDWPALRHARHLALREAHLTLPNVRQAFAEATADASRPSILEFEQADAVWDPATADASAEAIVGGLAETRFELLQGLEAAPDDAWERPIPAVIGPDASTGVRPVQLGWLVLSAKQHELEHLAAIWRLALHWDGVPRTPIPGVPLHPADRLEESH
jgi:hypothetical protein